MRLLFPLIFIALLSINSFAAVRTWDGGGADANWQTAANWLGDVAPAAGDDLVFPAVATQFATNNNFFFLTNFNSITFEGGTYTVAGNPFRLTGGLTANSGTQSINTSVALAASQSFTAATGATVTLIAMSQGSFQLTVTGAGNFGFGLVSGSGMFIKNGSGAALIAGASGFGSPISILGGIVVVDANIPNSSVTINTGVPAGVLALAGLGGTGTVGAVNVSSGGISAGTLTSPIGILNMGNLSFNGESGAYLCKIGGIAPGTGYDQLNVTGSVNLNNARLAPLPWNAFRPAIGDSFVILRNDGTDPINGTFFNAPEGAVFSGPLNTAFRITYIGGDGNDVVITRVPKAAFDFDGDGKTDVSTFNEHDGKWSISNSGGGITNINFGVPTDKIVPADYDGDNKTDIAIFRGGAWWILNSLTLTVTTTAFGSPGDLPVPNDFDGDGRADLAVFRPSNGTWYQLRSFGSQFYGQQFGVNGDIPQIGDFDGDGIGDLCVYRPTGGEWHFFLSGNNAYSAFQFGVTTDKPVPADYDGDGKTDVAIFRATNDPNLPDFYILPSGTFNFYGLSWGVSGDVPVVGDYDGDGKADVAIFRPGTFTWYLMRSTTGFAAQNWGTGQPKPVPSAFIR